MAAPRPSTTLRPGILQRMTNYSSSCANNGWANNADDAEEWQQKKSSDTSKEHGWEEFKKEAADDKWMKEREGVDSTEGDERGEVGVHRAGEVDTAPGKRRRAVGFQVQGHPRHAEVLRGVSFARVRA